VLFRLTAPFTLALVSALTGCRERASSNASVAPVTDRSHGEPAALEARHADDGAITIDGHIREPAWRVTGTTGGFVHPGTGAPVPTSKVKAQAWITWDDTAVYIAARVEDPSPVSPFNPTDEDPHVWERASGVELMLQPGDPGDNREYYEIQVAVNGARWTTRFDDYNRPITAAPDGTRRYGHQDWSPALRYATHTDRERGYYEVEFALPWSDVRSSRVPVPPRIGDRWRVNLYSFRDGQGDSLAWSPLRGEGNFHRAARFGTVTFVGR